MIICKDCGTPQIEGTLYCNECGRFLLETAAKSTHILPFSDFAHHEPPAPMSDFHPQPLAQPRPLTFIIPSSRRRVKINLIDQIRIGRAETKTGTIPELNLSDDDGAELGVSRMHAAIKASNKELVIIDLGSTNGTLLNNSLLLPELPYPLKNGDEIRVGELLVHILF